MEDAVRENCKIPGLALVLSEHMSVRVVLSKAVKITFCHDCPSVSFALGREDFQRFSQLLLLWCETVKAQLQCGNKRTHAQFISEHTVTSKSLVSVGTFLSVCSVGKPWSLMSCLQTLSVRKIPACRLSVNLLSA